MYSIDKKLQFPFSRALSSRALQQAIGGVACLCQRQDLQSWAGHGNGPAAMPQIPNTEELSRACGFIPRDFKRLQRGEDVA
ncbi:MAG: hypothetical protein E5X77_40075, partial [Mesorhizobium sp.]